LLPTAAQPEQASPYRSWNSECISAKRRARRLPLLQHEEQGTSKRETWSGYAGTRVHGSLQLHACSPVTYRPRCSQLSRGKGDEPLGDLMHAWCSGPSVYVIVCVSCAECRHSMRETARWSGKPYMAPRAGKG
jgi:hypothetical protein